MTITVNGITVDEAAVDRVMAATAAGPSLRPAAERVAAVRELLLARARALGLDRPGDEDATLDAILERELRVPQPNEAECRRYYEARADRFRSGDLVGARHVLFAVLPGTPVDALRRTAEKALAELVSHPERFDEVARQMSNCPSGQHGGNLGQLQRGETVPEFDQALFDGDAVGVLPWLVTTRHGFHIVCVDRRIEGRAIPFEAARAAIAEHLVEATRARALAQYVRVLAGEADLEGVDLGGVPTPLVQ